MRSLVISTYPPTHVDCLFGIPLTISWCNANGAASSQFFLKQSWSQKYDPLIPSLPSACSHTSDDQLTSYSWGIPIWKPPSLHIQHTWSLCSSIGTMNGQDWMQPSRKEVHWRAELFWFRRNRLYEVELIGSGLYTTIITDKGLGGMASTGSRFRPLMRDAMYVPSVRQRLMKRGILLWVPVGVFFTRHIYSFASITGSSMQVSHLIYVSWC